MSVLRIWQLLLFAMLYCIFAVHSATDCFILRIAWFIQRHALMGSADTGDDGAGLLISLAQ